MHKFLQTPLTQKLPKFVLGDAPLFNFQPYNEAFTTFARVDLELLEQDWYFFNLLAQLGYLAPAEQLAPGTKLNAEQELCLQYWQQMAQHLQEQVQADYKVAQVPNLLNLLTPATYVEQATLTPALLPEKISPRAYLFLALSLPYLGEKLSPSQVEQALSMRCLFNHLLCQVYQGSQDSDVLLNEYQDTNQWVLVVSDQAKLTPDWQARLEGILTALQGRSQVLANPQLLEAAKALEKQDRSDLANFWRAQNYYRQQYLIAVEDYAQSLEQNYATADRLMRTAVIALDNQFELEAEFEASTGLGFIASQSWSQNLPNFNKPQAQSLHFLHSLNGASQGAYLLNLAALANLKVQALAPAEQAFGIYAQIEQQELGKLKSKLKNYRITYPQASVSLDPFGAWFVAQEQRAVLAQAQPSLAQVPSTAEQKLAVAQYQRTLPGYNYSGNYLGQGYDYLATCKHLVLSYMPASQSQFDLFNQLGRADLQGFISTSPELALGNFYKQPHTLNFVPVPLQAKFSQDEQVLAGNFFTPQTLIALFAQLSKQNDILAHDYILVCQTTSRFATNWYGQLNQQLALIFAQELPPVIALGGQDLGQTVKPEQLSAFLVQKQALASLIERLEASQDLEVYCLEQELVTRASGQSSSSTQAKVVNLGQDAQLATRPITLNAKQFKLLAQSLDLTPKELRKYILSESKKGAKTTYTFAFTQLIEQHYGKSSSV
ncbi:hypothetical protein CJP74_01590 [Psittacicella melopsittaci]|uniref:Uncharacterized protein n=1 Tax=Psittacicella melopsittaci TaxID=2028576 RepID=A0A3A1Y7J7_9GAMM|nr:hypothetical protein [Psittacicella melopsittaci]RIY33585.1 hypothetical protein CJP74_01590 [Psittacicella melopsittaci]